ncbi:MAG TPA: NAD(+)/NADH kinase [Candidatus Omnitrophota bacterium]|nr:NAD(+)/NADH kinase [Candidatus Omnitrophota bacterium]
MFQKIILVYKENLQKSLFEKIEEIKRYFPESDFFITSYSSVNKQLVEDADLIITIGGDGTFIKAGHLLESSFILGINSDPEKSEGALTSININEIEKLESLNSGRFNVTERQRAEVFLNGKLLDERAVNEVYIGSSYQFHTSRYKIRFRGLEEEHRSSGIIISTGTGSRAWFLSAGGKPFHHEEKKLGFIVREPYFGERIFTPKLLSGEILEGEKIEFESTRDSGGIIAINDSIYDFKRGDAAEIRLSGKPLKVITPKF